MGSRWFVIPSAQSVALVMLYVLCLVVSELSDGSQTQP